ncbi:MAG: hypothetical protein ACLUOI_39740 [Eisenbergiella sp.]
MYHFIFVDDEDYIRELFQEIMDYREFGFELAASFSSAEQALAYIRQGKNGCGINGYTDGRSVN